MTITVMARSRRDPMWIGDGIRVAAVGWERTRLYLVVTVRGPARVRCPGRRIRRAITPDGRHQAVFWLEDGEGFRIDGVAVRIARAAAAACGVVPLEDLVLTIAAADGIEVYRERGATQSQGMGRGVSRLCEARSRPCKQT